MLGATSTYALGQDGGDLAARARELGLDARADRLDREHRGALTRSLRGFLADSSRYGDLLASIAGPEDDGDDDEEKEGGDVDEGGHDIGEYTPSATILAIVKATIGPAVLFMPKGFQEGGIAFSVPMMGLSFLLVAWGSTSLLAAAAEFQQQQEANRQEAPPPRQLRRQGSSCSASASAASYAGLMGIAFGPSGTKLARVFIVCQQFGICLTYFVFVAHNLHDLLVTIHPAVPNEPGNQIEQDETGLSLR